MEIGDSEPAYGRYPAGNARPRLGLRGRYGCGQCAGQRLRLLRAAGPRRHPDARWRPRPVRRGRMGRRHRHGDPHSPCPGGREGSALPSTQDGVVSEWVRWSAQAKDVAPIIATVLEAYDPAVGAESVRRCSRAFHAAGKASAAGNASLMRTTPSRLAFSTILTRSRRPPGPTAT